MPKIPIVGPGYLGRSSNVNASRCVNFYPEVNSQDSKSVTSLPSTPGLGLWASTQLDSIRGMHSFNGAIYFVSGNKLYSVNSAKFVSPVIDSITSQQVQLATSTGTVSMSNNGIYSSDGAVANQLLIADGQNITTLNVTTMVSVSNAFPAKTCTFIGSYFVIDSGTASTPKGGKFRVSGQYDGTTWSGLDIATAESSPDNLMAVANNHDELWLIGEETTEIWYQSGSGNPPFAKMAGGVMDYGTPAPYSVAKGSNTLFFLVNQRNNDSGELFGIGMANGYGVEIISTPAINYQISKYSVISDAIGFCYSDNGHAFYQLTFPTANATWVYDVTTKLWHERSLYTGSPYVIGRHVANCYAYAWGKHFVGAFNSGKIYEMSENYFTDDGLPIVSLRTESVIDVENKNLFVNRLQIEAETGVGDGSVYVQTNPQLLRNVTVGTLPRDMATDGSSIWVANTTPIAGNVCTITKFDLATGTVLATINIPPSGESVAANPIGIDYAFGCIWVGCYGTATVVKINPTTNLIVDTISVNGYPLCITHGITGLWVGFSLQAGSNTYSVARIDPNTDVITNTFGSPITDPWGDVYGMVFVSNNGNYIYTANNVSTPSPGSVTVINTDTQAITNVFSLPAGNARGICFDGTDLWVTCIGNVVYRINQMSGNIIATITVPHSSDRIIYDGFYIWVTQQAGNSISLINGITNQIDLTLNTGSGTLPDGLLYIGTNLYVSNRGTGTVSEYVTRVDSPNSNPLALLSWSDDGGHTWSNDHQASLGSQGNYYTRMQWLRLGYSKNRIFRVAISASVKKVLIDNLIDFETSEQS